jgi:hypothetical protein
LWLVRQIIDIFAALSGFYYSRKYAILAARLGRSPARSRIAGRGFVIVQIDGLSHEQLQKAIDAGHMPHLAHQIRQGRLQVAPWRCGLPSTTPASQAGIMFGNNHDIPGFRWYEKESGLSVVCKLPANAKMLQDRVSGQQPGILRDGSSFCNMFDGGASLSLFTLSALNRERLFAMSRGVGFLLLFLLNPFRTLRVLLLSLREYVTDLVERTVGAFRGERRLPLQEIFPLVRAASNVAFPEVQTFAVLLDIYRGVPAVYTTYYSYDEVAHHYGHDSRPAQRALRELDRRLRQIDRLRRARLTREYDLFVIADHGQTPSEPFAERYGQTLGQFIRRCLGSGLVLQEQSGDEQQSVFQAHYLLQELQGIQSRLAEPLAVIARRVHDLVSERVRIIEGEPAWDLGRRSDVVVKDSGSLAHVYFNVSSARLRISEISALFPDLVVTLASHPGLWLVVGTESEDVLLFSREGVLTVRGQDLVSADGGDPLRILPDPEHARRELVNLARYPHSGDLILLGRYDPQADVVLCFEDQWASHGGLGGGQDYPFLVYPAHLPWDLSRVSNAREMYAFFARAYLEAPLAARQDVVEPAFPVPLEPFC